MEEEFDYELFRELVKQYMNQTPNVEDVLNEKKEEISAAKKSFELLWEGYNSVSDERKNEIAILRKASARIYLYSFVVYIFSKFNRSDAVGEMDKLLDSLLASIKDLKDEKELLLMIKNTIQELEKYNAPECNYDLSLLLALINEKHGLMYDITTEDINSLAVRMNGISYMTDNNKREDLKNVNENIEYKVNELKLRKTY